MYQTPSHSSTFFIDDTLDTCERFTQAYESLDSYNLGYLRFSQIESLLNRVQVF